MKRNETNQKKNYVTHFYPQKKKEILQSCTFPFHGENARPWFSSTSQLFSLLHIDRKSWRLRECEIMCVTVSVSTSIRRDTFFCPRVPSMQWSRRWKVFFRRRASFPPEKLRSVLLFFFFGVFGQGRAGVVGVL